MAVPKKRTSKMKTRLRKTQWKAQATSEAQKALSKAKTVIKALLKTEPEIPISSSASEGSDA